MALAEARPEIPDWRRGRAAEADSGASRRRAGHFARDVGSYSADLFLVESGRLCLHRPAGQSLDNVLWEPLGENVLRHAAQRTDVVEDVCGAAVRGDDEVVIARMDLQSHHRRGRESVLPLEPALAGVLRDPQTELRAEEEQIGVNRILLDRERVALNVFRDE